MIASTTSQIPLVAGSASLVGVELVEVACDDRHWDCQGENARDGTGGSDDPSQRAYRHLVSIAHGGHGDDGPPKGVRNAVDL